MTGPPAFGTIGVLAVEDGGARVQCHMCGRWWSHLGCHTTRAHGVTPEEYKTQFGLMSGTGLVSPVLAERRRQHATEQRLWETDGSGDFQDATPEQRASWPHRPNRAEYFGSEGDKRRRRAASESAKRVNATRVGPRNPNWKRPEDRYLTTVEAPCGWCGATLNVTPSRIARTLSGKVFCNKSHRMSWQNRRGLEEGSGSIERRRAEMSTTVWPHTMTSGLLAGHRFQSMSEYGAALDRAKKERGVKPRRRGRKQEEAEDGFRLEVWRGKSRLSFTGLLDEDGIDGLLDTLSRMVH